MNLNNALSQVNALTLAVSDERTSSLDGTSIDLQAYEGVAAFVLNAGKASAGTTPTLNAKLQHSADDSTFADVTGGAFTEVTDAANSLQVLKLNVSDLKRYVKLVGTIAGSGATFDFGAEVLAVKKAVSS